MTSNGFRSRAALPIAALLLTALAGCSGSSGQTLGNSGRDVQQGQLQGQRQPVATRDTDWAGVAQALGRPGKLVGTVYRVPLVRSDLTVVSQGVTINPGLSLGGYAAFTRYGDASLMMGDLVVTEAELPKVTDALQTHGIAQTALHKHLLQESPPVWWTHVHTMGDPVRIAQGCARRWMPPASPRPRQPLRHRRQQNSPLQPSPPH